MYGYLIQITSNKYSTEKTKVNPQIGNSLARQNICHTKRHSDTMGNGWTIKATAVSTALHTTNIS